MSLTVLLYASSALICGTMIGLLVTGIFISRALADISRTIKFMDIELRSLVAFVEATKPNHLSETPKFPVGDEPDGGTVQLVFTTRPDRDGSGPLVRAKFEWVQDELVWAR